MQIFWAILAILLVIMLATKYFERFCDSRMYINCGLEHQRVVQDQEFSYNIEILNKKLLALPIIKVVITVPSKIMLLTKGKSRPRGLVDVINSGEYQLTLTTSLLCYQKVVKRLRFAASKRGLYAIKTRIYLKDLLGITTIEITPETVSQLIIHPRITPFKELDFAKTGLQGDHIIQRWIQPDTLFYTGVRPYEARDGFKDIDWKVTAKMQSLYVKKYDYTSDTSIAAFILGDDLESQFAQDPQYIESAVNFCASLCNHAYENQYPISVSSNLFIDTKISNINLPDLSLNHMTKTYDLLSGITNYHQLGLNTFLTRLNAIFTPNTTLVFICKKPESKLVKAIYQFANRGYKTVLIMQEFPEYPIHGCETHMLCQEVLTA